MIINKIILNNYGLYEGVQEFDLRPEKDKNIILIGGKNGAGKTTLFDSIKLCLYGDRTLEKRSRKKYDDLLRKKIHRNNSCDAASVEVEFAHSSLGKVDVYNVKRDWSNNGKSIKEIFKVKKNGSILENLSPDQWQDFINDLIPKGLSQLFFFDGEKIQNLAEDIKDDKQLADSFNSLLGIDIVEKLISDLEIYQNKEIKKTGSNENIKKMKEYEQKINLIQSKIEIITQNKGDIVNSIDKLQKEIDRQDLLIKKEGGLFAKEREGLKVKKGKLEVDRDYILEELREFSGKLLPFIFSKNLNKDLKKTLINEEKIGNTEISKNILNDKIEELKPLITQKTFLKENNLKKDMVEKIIDKFYDNLNYLLNKENGEEVLHGLSKNENAKLVYLINEIQKEGNEKIKNISQKYEKIINQLSVTQRRLSFAPDNETIGKFIKKIMSLNKEMGLYEQKLINAQEEIINFNKELEKNNLFLRKIKDEESNKDHASKKIKLARSSQGLLKEYFIKLKEEKLKEFSQIFVESFNELAHKKEMLKKIFVDPETYQVKLFGKNDEVIDKIELSAGEKQIYAIAVLWTLTKLSGRPLPFIIDTPLGRLDIDHRDNIVLDFFPKASHQLLVLSTDSEIDEEYMKKLDHRIAKKYLLNESEGSTKIQGGYYW
jgi:DNA sulfur modification protein DndD